ncbi:sigma-54-dependent Fis family transcriptional regulator [Paenibacillus hamazuiensis]|uniref:sigma-54-dependent Fis family transcriptional regulator n=1 Tax=Paenibacillus hamazuiensis TaxID=2936508 RepID=UPI00200D308C|nr:sigma-54-dependent Fis family transcriptional regulator [Paenibacillus hamazuiensis]
MKLKALVIAPYRGLAELASSLAEQLEHFHVTVVQGDLFELSLESLRKYEEEGYDVIISRGGTAKLIREHCSLPVVDIKVSGYDILRLITLLKEYKTKIHMIGFPNIISGVISVSKLLEVHFPHTIIHEQDEVVGALEDAKKSGALVIVGGSNTVRLAKEMGLQGVLVTSGRESVLEAFEHAQNMCYSIKHYQAENKLLQGLLNGMDTGAAVVDRNGELKLCNASFSSQLKLSGNGLPASRAFSEKYPKAASLLQKASKKREAEASFEFLDSTYKHKVVIVPQPQYQEEQLYHLYVHPVPEGEFDIKIQNLAGFLGSFPPLIQSLPDFKEAIAAAWDHVGEHKPLTVYGEQGTGKRILAGAISDRLGVESERLLEVSVVRGSEEAFEHLKLLMEDLPRQALCYIRGLERFSPKLQRRLAEIFRKSEAHLIASFEKQPGRLLEEGQLDADLYDLMCKITVGMKPLRENLQELEELVRIFIAENNEKYGKQVVGIRSAVLEVFYEQPWKGNLIELKDTVKELVKSCTGEYIDEETFALLQRQKAEQQQAGVGKTINLNQTFQEIQKDIIQIVLQEENMNQSRAAKRLGLNRSTLWRILKEQT